MCESLCLYVCCMHVCMHVCVSSVHPHLGTHCLQAWVLLLLLQVQRMKQWPVCQGPVSNACLCPVCYCTAIVQQLHLVVRV